MPSWCGQEKLYSFLLYLRTLWCWRRMEKKSWTDRVRNGEILQRVKQYKNILETIKRIKANWIGHILRRICPLKHVIKGKIEGRIEVTVR
jgi:hypothetical protein